MSSMRLAVGLTVTLAAAAAAQTGTITGRVTNAEDQKPLDRAVVRVLVATGATVASGATRADGTYRLEVAPGSYQVRIAAVGFGPKEYPNTTVGSGSTVTVNAALSQVAMRLEDI